MIRRILTQAEADELRPLTLERIREMRDRGVYLPMGGGETAGAETAAAGGETAGEGGEGAEGAAGGEGTPDPLDQRLAGFEQQLGEMGPVLQQMGQVLPGLQELMTAGEGEEGADPLQALSDYLTNGGNLDPETGAASGIDPAALSQMFSQAVDARVQGIVGDLGSIKQTLARNDLDSLQSEIPALQDPKVRNDVVMRTLQAAETMSGGNEALFESMKQNPQFVKLVYLARDAELRAQSETPAGAESEVVEGAGGVNAGGGDPGEIGDSIVAARRGGQGGFWQ